MRVRGKSASEKKMIYIYIYTITFISRVKVFHLISKHGEVV